MMKNWKKALAMVFCLIMMLAVAGCGGKSEKFTGSTWVYVHKTDNGAEDFIDVLTFEKNGKTYISKEKKTTYEMKYDALMNAFGHFVSREYKLNVKDVDLKSDYGMVYDEKSDSLTQNGFQLYTYMSKDDTIVDQNRKYIFKKVKKEDIEKIKSELETHTKSKIEKANKDFKI